MKLAMKKMTKKEFTPVDLYKMYPYKSQDPTVVAGRNYIPKEERVESHKYSLTIKQWKEIVSEIFTTITDELTLGKKVVLPHDWGTIYVVKWIPSRKKWFEDYSFTDNYKVGIKWLQTKRTPMGWALRLFWSKKFKNKIVNNLKKDRSLINNYNLL